MSESLTRTVTVRDPLGLHMRPADLLVRTAGRYASQITIGKNGEMVDCKSILSLLTLGADHGCELSLEAAGPDAADALDRIEQLFESGFDDREAEQVEGVRPSADH